jgi:aryl-alcohol dehydrogenase-like predicted oxidoreductase
MVAKLAWVNEYVAISQITLNSRVMLICLTAMTSGPKPSRREKCFEAMNTALKLGATFWSSGEHYGSRQYNSLHLLNKYFSKYP